LNLHVAIIWAPIIALTFGFIAGFTFGMWPKDLLRDNARLKSSLDRLQRERAGGQAADLAAFRGRREAATPPPNDTSKETR